VGLKKLSALPKNNLQPNNSVKQQTIYEIITNTTCISNKRTPTNQKIYIQIKVINKLTNYIQKTTKFLFEKNK
jgi:hypothetical protein